MNGKLPPVLGRTLAVVLLLAVLGAGYLLAAAPLLASWSASRDQVARATVLIERYRRAGATRPALEKQVAELRRRQSAGAGYLTGTSDTIAGAALQNLTKRMAKKSGAKINSSQILPAKAEKGARRIGVRLRMQADMAALQKILHALESGQPLLFLDKLQLRKQRIRRRVRRGRKTPIPTNEDFQLSVSLDIHGYLRVPSP